MNRTLKVGLVALILLFSFVSCSGKGEKLADDSIRILEKVRGLKQNLDSSKDPNQREKLTKEIQIAKAELNDITGEAHLSKKDEVIFTQKMQAQNDIWEKEDANKRIDSFRPASISAADWEKRKNGFAMFKYTLEYPDNDFMNAVNAGDATAMALFLNLNNMKIDVDGGLV